jgi:choline dehydrogenase
MLYTVTAPGVSYNQMGRGLGGVRQALRYAFGGDGLLGLPASPIRLYVRTREGLTSPDVGISVIPFLATKDYKLSPKWGLTMITHPLRSESVGSIHLSSAEPSAPPAIRFNFLSSEIDREATVAGMRIVRRLMNAPSMVRLIGEETAPGPAVQSDKELLDWVKAHAETTYHPVGTCKMGSDPRAVVDDRLRVHGLQGLRVADASIMPTLTSGNTNAPSIMIGEKAASLVLEEAA